MNKNVNFHKFTSIANKYYSNMLKHNTLRYIPSCSSELAKPPATVPKFNSSNILEISVTSCVDLQ